jgi:hypothetical protein
MPLFSAHTWRLAAATAITVLLIAGCQKLGEPMPPTYPVKGKVVSRSGKVVTGTIVFQPTIDTQMTCNSPLARDSTFSLSTLRTHDGSRADGAPAGEYLVTVFPESNSHHAGRPQTLPGTVVVKPQENTFEFEIDQENP